MKKCFKLHTSFNSVEQGSPTWCLRAPGRP